MLSSNYPSVWKALLSGCRKHGNVKLKRYSFYQIMKLDGGLVGAYMVMANIFTTAGMQGDAKKLKQ